MDTHTKTPARLDDLSVERTLLDDIRRCIQVAESDARAPQPSRRIRRALALLWAAHDELTPQTGGR